MGENIVRPDIVMDLSVKYVRLVTQKEKRKLLQKNNYLFRRANRKDCTQRNVKKIPVINIISFDKSAQNKFKKSSENTLLNASNPPRVIISPKKTTMCIINFFFVEINNANIEKSRIRIPKIDGINDVNDELSVRKFTNIPHDMRNIPYKIEIDSILSPKNLYSFCFMYILNLVNKICF